jgi:hypothetical protein
LSLAATSISPITAWRHDRGQFVKIELGDGLERLAGGGVAEAFWQGIEPDGIFSLQAEQDGNCVIPALWPGASVLWVAVSNFRHWLEGLSAGAIPGLSFGVAEGVLALGLTTWWHFCLGEITRLKRWLVRRVAGVPLIRRVA